jgi:hypothetical protein
MFIEILSYNKIPNIVNLQDKTPKTISAVLHVVL